jgi:hypothetical protein
MNDVTVFYEIVPKNDGSHYICRDENGNYYLKHKAEDTTNHQLAFDTPETAQAYIDKYLDPAQYHPEYFAYSLSLKPFDVITEVK